ncbi:MAG: hypothetical protein GY878_30815 [Fuerstiella sp.]|nr:hypothetical protein [Fuerstiella sp.]
MNKAFVREPDIDGRVCCPACESLGVAKYNDFILDGRLNCVSKVLRRLQPPVERLV